jgi:ankyrin repeat protein
VFNFFKSSENAFYAELLKDNIDVKKIQKYIDKGIDLNKLDEKGRTILFSLVEKRKIDAIRILTLNGANLNIEDRYKKTVLSEAIENNDGVMIRLLLELGASINHKNSSKRTVLQNVALDGNYKVFQILMNYKPDFMQKDSYGRTVLFDAIEGGNVDIIREIVNNMDNLNVIDENNQTALFKAVLKADPSIAKLLILNGINVNFLDKDGQNILFNAVLQGSSNYEIIELLIEKGININIVDNFGKNILDEILFILELQKNHLKNLEGKYKIIDEVKDYLKIALLLIENGLEIDNINSDKTTLEREIQFKNFDNIKFLVDCGADINRSDDNGKTLLYKEVIQGYSNYKMVDFLISLGANIEQKDLDEKTIIDDLIEIILIQKSYKKPDAYFDVKIKEDEKYDVLLKKILTYRPNIEQQRLDGKSTFFDLLSYNHLDLIKLFLNYGINPNIQDKKGNTPLSCMVEDGLKLKDKREKELFLERLVFLLKFRVNVDIQDNQGRTVFHKAVIANDLVVVEKLLTKKANLSIKDNQGRTALHHTKWHGNYKIARWLIAAGADMNQVDSAGFTLLNYAAIFGHVKLVITLIASGVLMYNKNPKSKKVAQFFKDREINLQKLLINNISDDKMLRALEEVVENTQKEVDEALEE